MPQLSDRQASLYAALAFVLTLLASFYLPGYSITLSGLLLVIFLSVFVSTRSSTVIAGVVSFAVLGAFLLRDGMEDRGLVWSQYGFMALLVLFTTLIVLYIKSLIQRMQFDKSHMTSLFENATEGIILTNAQAQIVLVNPAATRMFGYHEEELIGQAVETLLPKKYRAGHVQLRNEFYQHPSNRKMGSGRDLNGQRKDGTTFPVEVSLSSYRQQDVQ
ncbi:MAG: PAS domain S-box protein, partial [Chitinophagaceae bacterium]